MFIPTIQLWPLLLLECWSAAQAFPGTTEVDLIFPRNDTYAPTILMPIVAAIQNPEVAAPLNLAIAWTLTQLTNGHTVYNNVLPQTYNSASRPGTVFEYSGLYNLTITEGTWSLYWSISTINCTQFPGNNTSLPDYEQGQTIVFTTKKGAQSADLVAATGNGTCASTESFTFDVTSTSIVAAGKGLSTLVCANLGSPAPVPSPCAVSLNATGAASILAGVTASACNLPSSAVKCPSTNGASGERQLGEMVWMGVTVLWLFFTFA